MRSVMPEVFISMPARMKKGTQSSGKLSTPPTMRWTMATSGMEPSISAKRMEAPASATATGRPSASSPKKPRRRIAAVTR